MITIGIVGTQQRIGTTTQAMQIIICLKEHEYQAAYVEMNNHGYIEKMQDYCPELPIDKEGTLICADIELFRGKKVQIANRKGYDYLIKDYGSMTEQNFQKLSFLEQDIKIVVGGTKADEIESLEAVMLEECYADVYYMLNFVSPEQQQDAKKEMGEWSDKTYFSLFTPDPFIYKENPAYDYMLGE